MPKITFMGAGSSVFAKNVLGDCMLTPSLKDSEIALFDIDPKRLRESESMLKNINGNSGGTAAITAWSDRRKALEGADYVVNAKSEEYSER
jgi:alpha-galactosidase